MSGQPGETMTVPPNFIVDAWMQHPTSVMLDDPMFDPLRAWSGGTWPRGELPLEWTVQAMDEAGVGSGLLCAWCGPTGPSWRSSEPGRPIPYLDHVALEFPELVIVGGHIGYPWTAEMIALATKY